MQRDAVGGVQRHEGVSGFMEGRDAVALLVQRSSFRRTHEQAVPGVPQVGHGDAWVAAQTRIDGCLIDEVLNVGASVAYRAHGQLVEVDVVGGCHLGQV